MNLAVKLYETMPANDENVLVGISPLIPAIVIFELDTPPDETYTIMTEEEYQAYLVSISSELNAWKNIQATLPIQ